MHCAGCPRWSGPGRREPATTPRLSSPSPTTPPTPRPSTSTPSAKTVPRFTTVPTTWPAPRKVPLLAMSRPLPASTIAPGFSTRLMRPLLPAVSPPTRKLFAAKPVSACTNGALDEVITTSSKRFGVKPKPLSQLPTSLVRPPNAGAQVRVPSGVRITPRPLPVLAAICPRLLMPLASLMTAPLPPRFTTNAFRSTAPPELE